jgi:hypothetical protein
VARSWPKRALRDALDDRWRAGAGYSISEPRKPAGTGRGIIGIVDALQILALVHTRVAVAALPPLEVAVVDDLPAVRDQATTQDGPRAAHVRDDTTACGNPLDSRRVVFIEDGPQLIVRPAQPPEVRVLNWRIDVPITTARYEACTPLSIAHVANECRMSLILRCSRPAERSAGVQTRWRNFSMSV